MTKLEEVQRHRLEAALELLREARYRVTAPRIRLIGLLVASERPATIENLFKDLPPGSFDLVTLYRNLEVFEAIGFVRRTFLHTGTATFLHEPDGPVFHFVTRRTGKVKTIERVETAHLEAAVERVIRELEKKGYRDVRHSVQFYAD